jgi:hypothetical protein
MMQNEPMTAQSQMLDILKRKQDEYLRLHPQTDISTNEYKAILNGWARDEEERMRSAVFNETVDDVGALGVEGVVARAVDQESGPVNSQIVPWSKDVYDVRNSGAFVADPDGPVAQYARIRADNYMQGKDTPLWEDWIKNRPGQAESMYIDAVVKAAHGFEGAAKTVGQYVGKIATDLAWSPSRIAEMLGTDEQTLREAVSRVETADGKQFGERTFPMRGPIATGVPSDDDRRLERQYREFRENMYEAMRQEEGMAWAKGARQVLTAGQPGMQASLQAMAGAPGEPTDIREQVGGPNNLGTKLAGMTGAAVGIIPWSIPALATRNPRLAALMTTPFFAMGHSDAWDRRMAIYYDQVAHAKQNNLPMPARPSLRELEQQANVAGSIEYASEYVLDRVQRLIPNMLGWGKPAAKLSIPSRAAKNATEAIADSMSRNYGLIGAAKVAAGVAAAGVIEGVEELIPPLGQEFTDPFFIPEGYENDFWSAETAEAAVTGMIAGTLTGTGQVGITGATAKVKQRRARTRAREHAGKLAGIIKDKADRLATERLTQNAMPARGASVALHQVDEIGAGDRLAMFVAADHADATITDDVRASMRAAGMPDKPLGIYNGMRVYAQAARAAEVKAAIANNDVAKLSGNPMLRDPALPVQGAIVIRKDNKVVDVVPFSSTEQADAARPAIEARATRNGATVEVVDAANLPAVSERLAAQMDADATVRSLQPPSQRAPTPQQENRGIASLRSEVGNTAMGSKMTGKRNDPFVSEYLTEEETNGAANGDVEVDVVLDKVAPERMNDKERALTTRSGTKPTLLDAKVRFRIRRPDGSVEVIEKDVLQDGAYVNQSNPDGLYLIRANGESFTGMNLTALLLHELRHQLVGRSRAGAEYAAKLLYIDPILSMRGGAQYMADVAPDYMVELDSAGNPRLLSEEEFVTRIAGLHDAATSILSDADMQREVMQMEASKDPTQRAAAVKGREAIEAAKKGRALSEQLAEESVATAATSTTGQTLAKAIEWPMLYQNSNERGWKAFSAWAAYQMVGANWAGPWARQSLYEMTQRIKGVRDAQLKMHERTRKQISDEYRKDMQERERQRDPNASLWSAAAPVGAAAMALAAGGDDDESRLDEATKQLAEYKAAAPEKRAEMSAALVSAISDAVPVLAGTLATLGGTSRGGPSIPSSKVRAEPQAMQIEPGRLQARGAETMQPEPAPVAGRDSDARAIELGRTMFSQRPERMKLFSALSREIGSIDAKAMTGDAWSQRLKGLVSQGKAKRTEIEWSGLEDFLALPRESKVTKEEVTQFLKRNGVKVAVDEEVQPGTRPLDEAFADMRHDLRRSLLTGWTDITQLSQDLRKINSAEDPRAAAEAIFAQRDLAPLTVDDLVSSAQEDAFERRVYPEMSGYFYTQAANLNRKRVDALPLPEDVEQLLTDLQREYETLDAVGERVSTRKFFLESQLENILKNNELEDIDGYLESKDTDYTKYSEYTLPGGKNYRETILSIPGDVAYESPHWEYAENPVAHIRSNDRRSETAGSVLFIEEVQSDWGQAARKQGTMTREGIRELESARRGGLLFEEVLRENDNLGYPDWLAARDALAAELNGGTGSALMEKVRALPEMNQAKFDSILNYIRNADAVDRNEVPDQLIPDAPFISNTDGWLGLSLKQIVLDAVNGGYDSVAFVNGKQSSDRYSLGRQLDGIRYKKSGDGYQLEVKRKDTRDYYGGNLPSSIKENDLSRYVGDVVAEKIIRGGKSQSDGWSYLGTKDLSVPSPGMIEFYDKIVPSMLGKLVKKLGGSVETIDANTGSQQIGFRVTPKMMDNLAASGGLPMFSRRKLLNAASINRAMKIAQRKKWRKGVELKRAMQKEVLKAAKDSGINLNEWNDETKEFLIEAGVQDAKFALKQNANAIGWYDIKTRIALAVASLVYPELRTDPQARFAYMFAVAVTSNGMEVTQNFKLADKVYRDYRKTGKMDPGLASGKQSDAMKSGLETFNTLKEKWGLELAERFMLTNFKVSEMRAMGLDVSGESPDVEVRGAAILGPKIGNGFFSNLNGLFDALTMDRWLVRTWARWQGILVDERSGPMVAAVARFKKAVKALPETSRAVMEASNKKFLKTGDPQADALQVARYFTNIENRDAVVNDPYIQELRKSANQVASAESGEKETPGGPIERQHMREIFGEVLRRIQEDPKYRDLTMADLQAVLWYMEKRLYENAKVDADAGSTKGYTQEEAPDYANAAIQVARNAGIAESAIEQAVKEETDGRTGTARRGNGRQADQPASGLQVHAGGLADAKGTFLKSNAVRNVARGRRSGDPSFTYQRLGSRGNVGDGILKANKRLVSAIWSAPTKLRNTFENAGMNAAKFGELNPGIESGRLFYDAIIAAKAAIQFGSSVYAYSAEEYAEMRLFLSEDGTAGFALKPDGDMVSVFSSKKDSQGRAAVEVAVTAGAKKADAFDTTLPRIYADHGFRTVARLKWDETQAPPDWDKKTYARHNNGMPDVVFLVFDDAYRENYKPSDGVLASDYGAALDIQNREIADAEARRGTLEKPVRPTGHTDAQFSMRRGLRGVRDEAALRYIDRYDELLRYVRIARERGVTMRGLANPYTGARVVGSRMGAQQQDAERRYADLMHRMHLANVTREDMDQFLYAQHAEERNDYIASINPLFAGGGGSGMTTDDANAILDGARAAGTYATLDGFANEWRAMLRESLDLRRASGLITDETHRILTTRYQRYVPLRGQPAMPTDEDFDGWGEPGGAGLSTTGRGMPRAFGRQSVAEVISAQIAVVHEDAIRRTERNQVGQSFLNLVLAVDDPLMATVIRPTRPVRVPVYEDVGGVRTRVRDTTRYIHDAAWMQDRTNFGLYVNQPVEINGHQYEPGDLVVINIANRRLADAMVSPAIELRSLERALRNVNNGWRFMTTGMGNPGFAPVNMARDIGQASLNNLALRGFRDTVQMLRRWGPAFVHVFRDSWLGTQPTGSYRDFVQAGGDQVYWRGNDLDAKRIDFDELERRVRRRAPGDRGITKTMLGWYSGFFAAAETASRLAQFEQRIDMGDDPADAALAARDITVDFAKGGLAKPVLNTWYMFLNAGLQGTVNTLNALARSLTLAPSLIMLGYAQAAISRMLAGDDDETGRDRWDLVSDYDKDSRFHFYDPRGTGKAITFPMPYGYNVFVSLGVRLEALVNGSISLGEAMSGMLVTSLNAFNPIGGSGITTGGSGILTSVLPTMVRPFAEIPLNENYAGQMIAPEQFGRYPAPDSSLAFDNTPAAYVSSAEWLNEITGGDEFESGVIDISPNTIEYLVGYYMSGSGRMLNQLYKSALQRDESGIRDIPIVRSFITDSADTRRGISTAYYQLGDKLAPTVRRADVLRGNAPEAEKERAFASLDQDLAGLVGPWESSEKALRSIRRALRQTEDPAVRDELLKARNEVRATMIRVADELTGRAQPLE